MKRLTVLCLLPALVSCTSPTRNPQGTAQVRVNGVVSPVYTCELDPAFSRALFERDGKRTTAGFTVLQDEVVDEQIGLVTFTISGKDFAYPMMKCPVPQDGTLRFVWHGPQNDMRVQVKSQDDLLAGVKKCIGKQSPNHRVEPTK